MNIVLIVDNKYMNLLLYTLNSLVRVKNKSTKIDIYILSLKTINPIILNLYNSDDIKIHIIDNINLLNNYNINEIDKSKFLKFCIQDILPNLNKCIYLDCDIILNKDLNDLYQQDILNGKLMCVVKDHFQIMGNHNNNHFNTGMIYFNLNECRKINLLKTALEFYNLRGRLTEKMLDQPIFNSIIPYNRVVYISCLFNLIKSEFTWTWVRKPEIILKNYNILFHLNYNNINDLFKDAYVYHFAGPEEKDHLYNYIEYKNEFKYLSQFLKNKIGLDMYIECKLIKE